MYITVRDDSGSPEWITNQAAAQSAAAVGHGYHNSASHEWLANQAAAQSAAAVGHGYHNRTS